MDGLLAAIRSAFRAEAVSDSLVADDLADAGQPDAAASASNQSRQAAEQEDGMSTTDNNSGAAPAATVARADHEAGVRDAETRGREAGASAATERFTAALGAEGVKGDAGRMAAALDLLQSSPAMAGADVASFVTKNVSAAPKPDPAAAYEAGRVAAAGQALPASSGQAKPAAGKADLAADMKRRHGIKN